MKKKSVCFTGHRNVKLTQEQKQRLYSELEALIHRGAIEFYAGGALGWDTICALTVLQLREHYTHIHLNLVLPCPIWEQTLRWNDKQKSEYYKIFSAADNVEILCQQYEYDCMKKRNAKLIEYADCCVCYYNPKRKISGTGQTVRMAQKKKIEILNIAKHD